MSDALVAARKLASLISSEEPDPALHYRRWERGQWRRRLFVNRLALTLTGSSGFARRAVRGLQRRPSTLNRLLEINDGSRGISSLGIRDWSALAGVCPGAPPPCRSRPRSQGTASRREKHSSISAGTGPSSGSSS